MKRKVFIYYLILIVLGVSITGFFTSQLTQKYNKNEVKENLINSALLIKYQLTNDSSRVSGHNYDLLSKQYSKVLNPSQTTPLINNTSMRITFIDFNGKVLGDSEVDYRTMENHLNRKEVKEAIQGETGEDLRYSTTLKLKLLYIAIPLKSSKIVIRVAVPLIHLKQINETIWYYTILSIILGLIFTSFLALWFSTNLTRPIKKFIDISKEFSSGNYSRRININSKDEFKQLGNTFNGMADKLELTIADLIDKNIKVDSIINNMSTAILAVDKNYNVVLINSAMCDLLEIKYGPGVMHINILRLIKSDAIKQLLQETIESNCTLNEEISFGISNERVMRSLTSPIKTKDSNMSNNGGIISLQDISSLKKLEQMRTEFVSNVTHELKTPLTSIRGFVETLRSGAINDKDVAEKFLEIIDLESERLYILINDILQLSEIEMKQKDTNMDFHNLKSIVNDTFTILGFAAEKKEITLIDETDENVTVYANADRIKQMLINLVDNGIKYNIEKGVVKVRAYRLKGENVIEVEDTGIGISSLNQTRIFERFYRVDKGRSRSMGGTGLGLSIVKHIVNLYNGNIKVSSEPGKGTVFTIQLPV